MKSPSRVVLCAIALAVSFFASAPAFADVEAHGHPARAHYPMKADEFKKLIEKRIAGVKAAIDKKLERNGVSVDRRAEIRRAVDLAASDLRAAMEKAVADGVVTKDEGAKVRSVADKLRGKVREQLRNEKKAQKKAAGDKREKKKVASKPGEKKPDAAPVSEE